MLKTPSFSSVSECLVVVNHSDQSSAINRL